MMNNRHTKIAFSCSPKLTGKVSTAFGLLLLPVEINNCMAVGLLWHWLTTPALVIMVAAFAAGIGLWFFKRTAIERTVTLGGWTERLYRRGRTAYFAVTMGVSLLLYAALSANCAGVYADLGMTYGDAFARYFIENLWMLLVMFQLAVERYTAFWQYDRSPATSRRVVMPPFRGLRK